MQPDWDPLAVDGNMCATPSLKCTLQKLTAVRKDSYTPQKPLQKMVKSAILTAKNPKRHLPECVLEPVFADLSLCPLIPHLWRAESIVKWHKREKTTENIQKLSVAWKFSHVSPIQERNLKLPFFHLNGRFTQWSFESMNVSSPTGTTGFWH